MTDHDSTRRYKAMTPQERAAKDSEFLESICSKYNLEPGTVLAVSTYPYASGYSYHVARITAEMDTPEFRADAHRHGREAIERGLSHHPNGLPIDEEQYRSWFVEIPSGEVTS